MAKKEPTQQNETIDLTVVKEKVSGMQAMVDQTKVTNDQELAALADKIKGIKMLGKFIRQEMEKYTKPAMEIVRNAQAKYLPYEKEVKKAEDQLKVKANAYMAEQEKIRLAKEEKIMAQVGDGKIKETTAMRKLETLGDEKKSVSTGNSTITRKMVKVAYIVDPTQIPKEYWVIDEVRVKKAAIAGAVIPGVEVREEGQMAIR